MLKEITQRVHMDATKTNDTIDSYLEGGEANQLTKRDKP
jgi:hypothetical protein